MLSCQATNYISRGLWISWAVIIVDWKAFGVVGIGNGGSKMTISVRYTMISTRKRNQAQRTMNEKYVIGLVLVDWILVREDDFYLGV